MSVGAVNKNTGDRIPTAGMPAIDDALDLTSVNPVQNAIITAALANKQDKTDNSLQTTDKTVVGAINEHEGDIGSLKSGLTNFNVALSVPENSGKNLIPLTIDNLKAINTNGTWSGNAYTINGVTFTGQTDSNGNITSIVANGTATGKVWFRLVPTTFDIMNGAILSGITNGSLDTFSMYAFESNDLTVIIRLTNGEYTFTNNYENVNMYINILSGVTVDNITFYPMLRPAGTTPTFAPYIPSVESRIEAVESNLSGVFTADLLYEGAPTTAETYEEMNLISGKSITDYLLILFICRQYNNTVAFAIEPRHVFTQQTGDGSRVIFKYGDGALQTVMVYYVSPTKIAVNQKTVDGAIWKTALYGIIKQP